MIGGVTGGVKGVLAFPQTETNRRRRLSNQFCDKFDQQ